jgi:hypothetical protein
MKPERNMIQSIVRYRVTSGQGRITHEPGTQAWSQLIQVKAIRMRGTLPGGAEE